MHVMKRIGPRAWMLVLLVAAMTRWYALDAVPPGIKYDTTSSAVYALNVAYNGARPFYIIPSGAPEPLMVYLQAIAISFFGPTIFTLRFLSAAIGVIVVALLYALAKETTRDDRIALVAAFALAVAVDPINITRTGLRATLEPLFETAWLLWFWRGWSRGCWRDIVIAGAILGLGVYTYIVTLAMWFIAAGLWAHQFLFARARWRARLRQTISMFGIALALAVPRMVFQITFPSAGVDRANEVNIFHNPAIQTIGLVGVVGGRLLDYVRMFGIAWQGELYNVLHRPLLDPFLFVCLLLGVLICLARLRRIEWAWAPLTLAVMLLPDLLGANEPSPNELRTIGVLTPAFFMAGVGAAFLLDLAARRAWLRALASGVLALALMTGAAIGLKAYWVDFAAAAQSGPDADYNRTEIAEAQWITRQSEPVFLPLNEYARSPVHFLVGARAARLRSALTADGALDSQVLLDRAWVLFPIGDKRPRTEGRAYVNDPAAFALVSGSEVFILPPAPAHVEATLQARAPDQIVRDSLGNAVANAYSISNPADLFRFERPSAPTASAQFDQGITLVAGRLDSSRVEPGTSVGVSLFWRAQHPLTSDNVIFVHVLDIQEHVVVGADVIPALGAYPTYLWKAGEIVATHHALKIPANAKPGKYIVEIGMYNVLNQDRLDVLDANGAPADSRVIIGTLKVLPSRVAVYTPSHSQRAEFDHAIALTGFDVPADVAPGGDAKVTLYWQSLATVSEDYTVFVHLLDARGRIVAQADHQPQAGQYPTSIWDVGEQVRDDFSLTVPTHLSDGSYRFEIGWYDLSTGKRLALSDGADHLLLDTALEVGR
jgi:4-amino-4-deoxy-L-arabinose transferase-like glycosyltransferase